MNLSFNHSEKWTLLNNTVYFFKKHFLPIIGLGLIAAFGRVIQLGGFGQITGWMNVVLEAVVESARILLFLYVLGLANVKNGVLRIKHVLTHKDDRKTLLTNAIHKLKKQWLSLALNIIGFLVIASIINYLIDLLAYETCLYLSLKTDGILAESSSEWTILLFFKNLTVIPLTLIFDTVLLLWLANKLSGFRKPGFV
ncbi:MAG TPA: hypothetical protein VFH07_02790 [Chitinophagaceae bacterium]|nr:hypothetical protein [Chitinophagaceae bacterium]